MLIVLTIIEGGVCYTAIEHLGIKNYMAKNRCLGRICCCQLSLIAHDYR